MKFPQCLQDEKKTQPKRYMPVYGHCISESRCLSVYGIQRFTLLGFCDLTPVLEKKQKTFYAAVHLNDRMRTTYASVLYIVKGEQI